MNGDIDENEEQGVDEESGDDIVEGVHEETVVDADVEQLVARIDKTDVDDAAQQRETRRRLEELREKREKDLDSTFNFNLDEEL